MTVPIGTMMAYAGDANYVNTQEELQNQGWLICNGDEYPTESYPDLYTLIQNYYGTPTDDQKFKVPDLRGLFVRGIDNGRGEDPDAESRISYPSGGNSGDKVGSYQVDAFKQHSHEMQFNDGAQAEGSDGGRKGKYQGDYNPSMKTQSVGGNETRPKNIYVYWIIKAKDVNNS